MAAVLRDSHVTAVASPGEYEIENIFNVTQQMAQPSRCCPSFVLSQVSRTKIGQNMIRSPLPNDVVNGKEKHKIDILSNIRNIYRKLNRKAQHMLK